MIKIFSDAENQAWAHSLPGKMSSACLAVVKNNKVLMVKASYKDHWTFPSGIIDVGESPKQAAVRETLEETGLLANVNQIKPLAIIYTCGKDGDRDRFNVGFITQVEHVSGQMNIPNEEIEDYKWVEFRHVAKLAGDKKSYIEFQKRLLRSSSQIYVEI